MTVAAQSADHGLVTLRYQVPRSRDEWTLPEEPVPESQPHDTALDTLKALLAAWVARTGLDAQVARNLALRWDPKRPNVGANPDLCLIQPSTPEGRRLSSLCLWQQGHLPPPLVIEVVSENRPQKDYVTAPERYAACGVQELWVFDPLLCGPASHGGPVRLQVWRRDDEGEFRRQNAGDGPAYSPLLDAWLVVVSDGMELRIASDRTGRDLWLTAEERERAEKDRERAEKEQALERVAELERKLREAGREGQ